MILNRYEFIKIIDVCVYVCVYVLTREISSLSLLKED